MLAEGSLLAKCYRLFLSPIRLVNWYPLMFQDWSVRYNQDEPVAPRYEINAPDLYIPGKVYILLAFFSYPFV